MVTIDEHPAGPADIPIADAQSEAFDLDGYPAIYREVAGYRALSALTWYRPDVTVTLSSHDRVSSPLLVDVALELH